jgi:regulation of enolase protein 1 (concanavalin A-like superfamily)
MSRQFERLEARRLLAARVVGDSTVYATIQAAVDAALPGGVVTVDAGVYPEMVVVNKKLTIEGARAGEDARTNARAGGAVDESVVTGTTLRNGLTSCAFQIRASGVTIDGFTVQGQTSIDDATGAGIVIAPNQSGTLLANNIVQNNATGVYLANNSAVDAAVIRRNLFRNNNNDGPHSGRAIYTDGGISGGNLVNVAIDANAFLYNTGYPATTGGIEASIALQTLAANAQSDIRITNNTFDQGGKAILFFNVSNALFEGNTVTYMRDQWSAALRFEGGNTNITLRNNTLYGNTGPAIRIDNKAVPGTNSAFVITGNNFYGNGYNTAKEALVVNGGQYAGSLDATGNWWNSSSGPGGDASGGGEKLIANGNTVNVSNFATSPLARPNVPYLGAPQIPGSLIQAEDFDHGGEGVAYRDVDSSNLGGNKYRQPQGVDIQPTSDTGGGVNTAYTKAGEWLQYTFDVPQGGTYTFDARVAYTAPGSRFHVEIDGANVTGSLLIPNTGGSQKWATMGKVGINLSAGTHVMRIVIETNGGNFNWFCWTPENLPTPVPPPAPSGLAASAASSSQIDLSWTDVAGESGYRIERSLDGITFTVIGTTVTNVTTFSDTTVAPSTQYTYRIIALGTETTGNSAPSATATETTPAAPTVPAAPTNLAATPAGPSEIDLTWTDNASNETGFVIERSPDGVGNWSQIATPGQDATSYSDTSLLTADTTYFYRVRAVNAVGPSGDSNIASAATLPAPPGPALPALWASGDIGAVGTPGSTAHSNGTWTVSGAGADIYNAADAFHFAYRPITGDATIVVRVASLQNTDLLAKAGIMFRDNLAAGSKHAGLFVTPGGGLRFIRRTSVNGGSASTSVSGPKAPYWLKLVRSGNVITAYSSSNGTTWSTVGSATVSMQATIYVGLAVTSKKAWTTTATFDNLSVA